MKNCNYLGMKGIKCKVFWINWRDDGEEPVKFVNGKIQMYI